MEKSKIIWLGIYLPFILKQLPAAKYSSNKDEFVTTTQLFNAQVNETRKTRHDKRLCASDVSQVPIVVLLVSHG